MLNDLITRLEPDVVYDIGAHDGLFTRKLRGMLPIAEIHQFEGSPKKKQKVREGPWHHVVLGAKDNEPVKFYYDGGTGDTYMPETKRFMKSNYIIKTVYTQRLDTYCKKHRIPSPDFIKIDVQGAELDVLRGCDEILSKCRLIHCEIPAEGIEFNQGSPTQEEYLQFFNDTGFIYKGKIKDHYRDRKLIIQHDYFFSKDPI